MQSLTSILLPYQRRFFESKKRRKLFCSSRQVGKSFCLAMIAAFKALSRKDGLSLVVSTGARAANEMMKKCIKMAEAVKTLSNGCIGYSSSADCIKFSNGSRILSLPSGNPAALRGYSSNCTIIDEAQFIEHPEDVMAAIAPTLTRDENAELVIASTPAAKGSWFWKMCELAKTSDEWHYQKTSIYDAVADGLKVDIERLKTLTPDNDIWRMEYEAEFLSEYSSMIDISLLDFQDVQESFQTFWAGMDIGSTSDRTAIAEIARMHDGRHYVQDIVMLHKASYESQLSILKQLNEKFHFNGGYIDANGIGGPVAEFAFKQVNARIKPFTWTSANKTPAYEKMRSLIFERKLVFAEKLRDLVVQEFQNVYRIVNEAGVVNYAAGRDANVHSDATSAIVLAIQAALDNPVRQALPRAFAWSSRL